MKYSDIDGWFDFEGIYKRMVGKAPAKAHFVELGSWLGKSSAFMACEIRKSKKSIQFDCVDIWQSVPEEPFYHPRIEEIGDVYHAFLDNMKKVGVLDIVKPIKLDSVKASSLYGSKSLNFVFVDANHTYEFVKKDIELWISKIKKGGYMGGHDYNSCEGVKRAVDEIFGENKEIIMGGSIQSWLVKI